MESSKEIAERFIRMNRYASDELKIKLLASRIDQERVRTAYKCAEMVSGCDSVEKAQIACMGVVDEA
jgi:predicted HTH domain antitoxin